MLSVLDPIVRCCITIYPIYELLNDIAYQYAAERWLGHVVRIKEDAPGDGYLMRKSAGVDEEKDLAYVGRSKSRKSYHLLVRLTGVGAQEAKAHGKMCYSRPKSFKRVVNSQLNKQSNCRIKIFSVLPQKEKTLPVHLRTH